MYRLAAWIIIDRTITATELKHHWGYAINSYFPKIKSINNDFFQILFNVNTINIQNWNYFTCDKSQTGVHYSLFFLHVIDSENQILQNIQVSLFPLWFCQIPLSQARKHCFVSIDFKNTLSCTAEPARQIHQKNYPPWQRLHRTTSKV